MWRSALLPRSSSSRGSCLLPLTPMLCSTLQCQTQPYATTTTWRLPASTSEKPTTQKKKSSSGWSLNKSAAPSSQTKKQQQRGPVDAGAATPAVVGSTLQEDTTALLGSSFGGKHKGLTLNVKDYQGLTKGEWERRCLWDATDHLPLPPPRRTTNVDTGGEPTTGGMRSATTFEPNRNTDYLSEATERDLERIAQDDKEWEGIVDPVRLCATLEGQEIRFLRILRQVVSRLARERNVVHVNIATVHRHLPEEGHRLLQNRGGNLLEVFEQSENYFKVDLTTKHVYVKTTGELQRYILNRLINPTELLAQVTKGEVLWRAAMTILVDEGIKDPDPEAQKFSYNPLKDQSWVTTNHTRFARAVYYRRRHDPFCRARHYTYHAVEKLTRFGDLKVSGQGVNGRRVAPARLCVDVLKERGLTDKAQILHQCRKVLWRVEKELAMDEITWNVANDVADWGMYIQR